MRALFQTTALLGLLSGSAVASEDREAVNQSCRVGMASTLDKIVTNPTITEADRALGNDAAVRMMDGYCGCIARTIPVPTMSAEDMRYVHYLLKESLVERGELSHAFHLAWNGLDEDKMALMALRMFEWNRMCSKAGE